MRAPAILRAHNLTKTYRNGAADLTVVRAVDLEIAAGETCAIVGPSGSGKTTLLALCAGLEPPTAGTVELNGVHLGRLTEEERAAFRRDQIGFVFQNFQLLPSLTALENVLLPLELQGRGRDRTRALQLLRQLGLAERADHYPEQLSGGEQQRVALARAFIHQPKILFADEPTGNLDAETSQPIVELLFRLNQAHGTTLALVTHDPDLAARAGRIIRLRAGAIVASEPAAPLNLKSNSKFQI